MFTVLVVEDDQPLSRLFGTILGRNGYNAHTVCTASAALHCLEQEYVGLIITDVMLPDMDGFELIRQLRESGSTLPILLVTARETLADKERGFTAGADDYMVKPVEVEELLLRVRALLRRALAVKKVLAPFRRFSDESERIARGDFSIRCDTHSPILEVRQIVRNLNAMVEELGTVETLREDFIAGVSHELKTPLTAIEGYAVLLGNRTSPRRSSVSTPRRFWTAPGGSPG